MEEIKRLTPSIETLRKLYTLSGNQCAYPGCSAMMYNSQGNFVGQICHIEAASEGGERFNSHMTNEQRRNYDNLMLMCYSHHIETNKVNIYTVEKMKEIKYNHENQYFNFIDNIAYKMQNSFQDITNMNTYTEVTSLSNLYITVDGKEYRDEDEILEDIDIFNKGINKFIKMSPQAINMFKIAFLRASIDKQQLSFGINGDIFICPEELSRVTTIDNQTFKSICDELIRNNFMYYDEDERKFFLYFPNSETNFWLYMKKFADMKIVNFDTVFNTFNFSIFD